MRVLVHFSILALCAATILFFLGYAFWASSRDWLAAILIAFFGIVALAPVFGIHFFLIGLKLFKMRLVFYCFSVLTISAGCYVYYDGLFVHLDALNALAFLFLPPLQIILLAVMFFICKGIEAIVRRIGQKRTSVL